MQIVIQVMCKGSKSLRDAVVNDPSLKDYRLYCSEKKNPRRPSGWAKLKSIGNEPGVINVEWSNTSQTLTARAGAKSLNRPYKIAGNFITYLLAKHSRRIVTILISEMK
jgi:hypothetical protein